jgi:hypothetical protein
MVAAALMSTFKVTESARLSPHRSVPLLAAFPMAPKPPNEDDHNREHRQRRRDADGDGGARGRQH